MILLKNMILKMVNAKSVKINLKEKDLYLLTIII